ncbi:MAG: hypothetical protein HOO91_17785 [Bacteroidales bacterium]|nr:hypothetical protein [Bacteroidales bacterium]
MGRRKSYFQNTEPEVDAIKPTEPEIDTIKPTEPIKSESNPMGAPGLPAYPIELKRYYDPRNRMVYLNQVSDALWRVTKPALGIDAEYRTLFAANNYYESLLKDTSPNGSSGNSRKNRKV